MIVDTSAIIAILLGEPEKSAFFDKLVDAPALLVSAGSWVELAAVQVRGNRDFQRALDDLFEAAGLEIAPVSVTQARIAHDAYRSYGIGSSHRARLNFGDCFAYALAKETGEPLLFKGDDFSHTDIEPAWVAEA